VTTTITSVVEWAGELFSRQRMMPQSTRAQWEHHANWLVPGYWDPATDNVLAALRTYVIRTSGRIILVDTGMGNHKPRPTTPPLDELSTDYLGGLARADVAPDQVDTVICTHLHPDHVGWNTRRDGGKWVPTFPNARYLLPTADYDMLRHLSPGNDHLNYLDALADSIDPIVRGGLADFWSADRLDIASGVHLERFPGHSPGNAVVIVESSCRPTILSGDVLHHPMQIPYPGQVNAFDAEPEVAIAARRRLLAVAADTDAVLLGAHFPGNRAPRVRRDADGFAIRDWVEV
jgi:glyoxylase-like metal-dependent hydrolase (beta-lactamase superfamily II)